jgi:hypothetical protein
MICFSCCIQSHVILILQRLCRKQNRSALHPESRTAALRVRYRVRFEIKTLEVRYINKTADNDITESEDTRWDREV